jgi:hypothetical protein
MRPGAFFRRVGGTHGGRCRSLKSVEDVELCAAAGYTFYTLDPGDHVDNAAHTDVLAVLRDKLALLPWDRLEDTPADLQARYLGREFTAGSMSLSFDEETLLRAACKYGNALAHVACSLVVCSSLWRGVHSTWRSRSMNRDADSAEEHFYISGELQRLGVHWVAWPRVSWAASRKASIILATWSLSRRRCAAMSM